MELQQGKKSVTVNVTDDIDGDSSGSSGTGSSGINSFISQTQVAQRYYQFQEVQ